MAQMPQPTHITLPSPATFSSYRRESGPMFFVAVQAPVDTNLGPTTAEQTVRQRRIKHLAWLVLLRIMSVFHYVAVLSIPQGYRCKFRDTTHPPHTVNPRGSGNGDLEGAWQDILRDARASGIPDDLEEALEYPLGSAGLDESMQRWGKAVPQLMKGWKTIQFGSGILIPCCFTVLQIELVLDNTAMRTLILAAAVLSIASLMCSTSYTLCASRWLGRCFLIQWLCASQPGAELEFWNFLSLPAIFLSWALLLFFVTVAMLSWGDSVDSDSSDLSKSLFPWLISGIIIILSIVISIMQIYRAFKRLYMA